ncbi:MAG: glucuronosyltransferase [Halioglobus sp.]|nr:glucuronosyltransferase [Halioglobus sp.]
MNMIFASVGTQLPFDRLIQALDLWASSCVGSNVFAQVGRGLYRPQHISWTEEISPQEFRNQINACDILVAHAGMGSIITGIELGKRVIVMPRLASLGEHRNEHQLATVSRLNHLNGFEVVHDYNTLAAALDCAHSGHRNLIPPDPDPELVLTIRAFSGLLTA